MKIFISYRRDDTGPTALLLARALEAHHGVGDVFIDLEDIPRGADFADTIRERLEAADVVLVVIGPRWLQLLNERASAGGIDWVRQEAVAALQQRAAGKLRVVPVFVDGATLGAPLPDDIAPLATANGVDFRTRAPDEGERRVLEAVQDETFGSQLDRQRRQTRARWTAVVAGCLLFIAAWAQLLDRFGIDTQIHRATIALAQLAGPIALPPRSADLAIIGLDDRTQAEHATRGARRIAIARAVSQTARTGARALAIDFELDDPDDTADAALEAALGEARRAGLPVLIGVRAGHGDRTGDGPEPALPERFARHVDWGVACVGQRADVVSTLPLVVLRVRADGSPRLIPSLGLATFSAAERVRRLGRLDLLDLRLPLERDRGADLVVAGFSAETLDEPAVCTVLRSGDLLVQQWLDERSPPLAGIAARVSLGDVARGDGTAVAALKDRIVLVGDLRENAPSDDRHATASATVPGVLLIAAQIDGLLRRSAIRPLSPLEQCLLLVGATFGGATLAIALRGPRARWLAPAVLAMAVVGLFAAVAAYRGLRVLAGPHYALIGLMLGAWLARRFQRR